MTAARSSFFPIAPIELRLRVDRARAEMVRLTREDKFRTFLNPYGFVIQAAFFLTVMEFPFSVRCVVAYADIGFETALGVPGVVKKCLGTLAQRILHLRFETETVVRFIRRPW